MRLPTVQTGRARLALRATALLTLTTAAACAGDQPITAPPAHTNTPSVAASGNATPDTDSTVVTFNIDHEGEFYDTGHGGISLTYTCSRALNESFVVAATLEQYRRDVGWFSSTSSYLLTCAYEGRPFEFFFDPLSSARSFERGRAIAAVLRVLRGD